MSSSSDFLHHAIPVEAGLESDASSGVNLGSITKKKKKKSAPKGILKNSDPNANYHHKSKHVGSLEELMENERPQSVSGGRKQQQQQQQQHSDSSSGHHQRYKTVDDLAVSRRRHKKHSSSEDLADPKEQHRRHSKHHSDSTEHKSSSSSDHHHSHRGKHSKSRRSKESSEDATDHHLVVEKNKKNHHRHHHDSSKHRGGGTEEKSSPHHHDSSSESRKHKKKSSKGSSKSESDRIYDQPKVPPVKYVDLHASTNTNNNDTEEELRAEVTRVYKAIKEATSESYYTHHDNGADQQQQFYENLEAQQALYDVPRSNRKVLAASEEAIYVNENCFEDSPTSSDIVKKGYDVPRVQQIEDLVIPQDYDVPKIRDSLSTIEEEHQEYDIPRSLPPDSQQETEGEDLYENQKGFTKVDNTTNIYANEKAFCDYTHANSSNDDRSSGYRSSSSPSIQSNEELYVNESAIASMEDLDSCGSSNKHSSPEPMPSVRDIGIETNLERKSEKSPKRSTGGKKSVKDKEVASREWKRDRERERSEEIEREIRNKRNFIEQNNINNNRKSAEKKESSYSPSNITQYFDNRKRDNIRNSPPPAPSTTSYPNFSELLGNKPALSSSIPQLDIPQDDFVTIGDIAGSGPDSDVDEKKGVIEEASDEIRSVRRGSQHSEYHHHHQPVNQSVVAKKQPVNQSVAKKSSSKGECYGLKQQAESKTSDAALDNSAKLPQKRDAAGENFLQEIRGVGNNNISGSSSSNNNNIIPSKLDSKAFTHFGAADAISPRDSAEGLKKRHQQSDRSVDVYHETVRQRVTRNDPKAAVMSGNVFRTPGSLKPEKPSGHNGSGECNATISQSSPPEHDGIEPMRRQQRSELSSREDPNLNNATTDDHTNEEMPSVRQLRSKFEQDEQPNLASNANNNPSTQNVSSKKQKAEKKSGFLVMSSLTRRGAVQMSKSLHNLKEGLKSNKATIIHEDPEIQSPKKATTAAYSPEGVDEQSIFASSELKFGVSGYSKSKNSKTSHKSQSPRDSSSSSKSVSTVQDKAYACKKDQILNQKNNLTASWDKKQSFELVNDQGKWQPRGLVAKMYDLPTIGDDEVLNNSPEACHIEGVVERLPAGKKKSTLWNTWKKQFVVADRGYLQIYTDESRTVLAERVELFSGKVKIQDGNVLGVEDRKKHYMALKCPSEEIAKKWKSALQNHIRQDFARSFVIPSPTAISPSLLTQILVVDIGGASIRAGIATKLPCLPQIMFPSVMAVDKNNEQAKYFGLDAFADEIRSRSHLSHPMVPNDKVNKYALDQIALQGIFEQIFKELAIEPTEYEIQLSVPRVFSDVTKQAIAGMLFEEFGVRAINMAHQTTFSFYAYNAKSGIMVDLGERMDVVPIVDGYKVQSGVSRSPVGGKEMRLKLQHYLLGRNYSLTSFIDSFVTRYAIERTSYVCHNFDKELDAFAKDPESMEKTLQIAPSDCTGAPVYNLRMGTESFEACEGLFKPELWGLDQAGIHVLVHKAIKECSMDVRKEITQSIFLAGGLTLIPGLRERLEYELERLTTVQPKVHASPYRYHAAFLGAMVHSQTHNYQATRVTNTEWKQAGNQMDNYWTM